MTLLANSFWTPLLALGRLNSWLRSDDPLLYWSRSALKPVIYWTKTHAILDTSKQWHIGMRRVAVRKPCRRCDATGVWLPYDWEPENGSYTSGNRDGGRPCRGCKATGTATLKFIETNIGPIRWHTPADRWYMSGLDVYVPFPSFYPDGDEHYESANGWEPNRKGRPLSAEEAERDMLIVLRAFPHHVCFSLDYHHHAGLESQYRCPDMRKAETYIKNLFTT